MAIVGTVDTSGKTHTMQEPPPLGSQLKREFKKMPGWLEKLINLASPDVTSLPISPIAMSPALTAKRMELFHRTGMANLDPDKLAKRLFGSTFSKITEDQADRMLRGLAQKNQPGVPALMRNTAKTIDPSYPERVGAKLAALWEPVKKQMAVLKEKGKELGNALQD